MSQTGTVLVIPLCVCVWNIWGKNKAEDRGGPRWPHWGDLWWKAWWQWTESRDCRGWGRMLQEEGAASAKSWGWGLLPAFKKLQKTSVVEERREESRHSSCKISGPVGCGKAFGLYLEWAGKQVEFQINIWHALAYVLRGHITAVSHETRLKWGREKIGKRVRRLF